MLLDRLEQFNGIVHDCSAREVKSCRDSSQFCLNTRIVAKQDGRLVLLLWHDTQCKDKDKPNAAGQITKWMSGLINLSNHILQKPMCMKDGPLHTSNSFKSPRSKSWPFPAAAITFLGKFVVGNGSDWPNSKQWPRSRSSVFERCSLSLTTITPLPIRFPASSIPAGRTLAISSLDN